VLLLAVRAEEVVVAAVEVPRMLHAELVVRAGAGVEGQAMVAVVVRHPLHAHPALRYGLLHQDHQQRLHRWHLLVHPRPLGKGYHMLMKSQVANGQWCKEEYRGYLH
jgi:hypothetical protein